VKEVKTGSSRWLREQSESGGFEGWQAGYGVFTATFSGKDLLIACLQG
jgi:hypothetical protein